MTMPPTTTLRWRCPSCGRELDVPATNAAPLCSGQPRRDRCGVIPGHPITYMEPPL